MAQKKAHEVDQFINRPNSSFPVVLLYGPDKGLVNERARRYAQATQLPLDDPFAVIRMEADEIDADPSRLADEARTISMFGGERLIWIKNAAGQKKLAEAIKFLAAEPPRETYILVEAGDLKKGAGLRSAVENAPAGMALPCYTDDARGVDGVIDDVLTEWKLQITMDARQLLRASLGGDRLATRGELEKLCLYVRGKQRIDIDDVREAVGDVAALSTDEVIDAVLLADLPRFEVSFDRIVKSGTAPFLLLNTATRQFQQIQALRHIADTQRKSASTVVAGARPPIFFNRKKLIENAVSRWSAESLTRVLERLQRAVLESRQNAALAIPIIRQCLLAIAVEAARNMRK
ncbi:DNA polymerase III subunit delta [Falsochrobactrum sp. TDYN1]|uniref:DNA polymerase III subunit delta n=1 Tax=Falsochrobactrum tianjinense TaxID=2706015 RepID=A0A949UT60_9HYPH|nr:DNA polymerase III subunit delta [Falsochrobactrum sp. TDYN1]MBV2142021.1 DNA polymerase III subunit delta [Falsochrobactrum sp. TDYN1]